MFDKLSIRLKIVLLAGLCLFGVAGLIVGINLYQTRENNALVSASSRKMLTESVQNLLQTKAAEKAAQMQKTFGDNLLVANAAADQIIGLRSLAGHRALPPAALREEINQAIKAIFERNPKVLGVWAAFEPQALDGHDADFVNDDKRSSNESGRYAPYWSRANGTALNTVTAEGDMNKTDLTLTGVPYNAWYTCARDSGKPCLLQPYTDTVGGRLMLMSSIAVPLRDQGKVIGVVGVDVALDSLQTSAEASQRDLFNGAGHMMIVSTAGALAANSGDASLLGKKVDQVLGEDGRQIVQLIGANQPKVL